MSQTPPADHLRQQHKSSQLAMASTSSLQHSSGVYVDMVVVGGSESPAAIPVTLRDDRSGTDSVPNGSSAGVPAANLGPRGPDSMVSDEVPLHPEYLTPPKLVHPLEQNVFTAFGRACAFHIAGFLLAIPLVLVLLLTTLVILPVRLLLCLLSHVPLLRRHLLRCSEPLRLRVRHCDWTWPYGWDESRAKGKRSSVCIRWLMTLQHQFDLDESLKSLNSKFESTEGSGSTVHRRLLHYSKAPRDGGCARLCCCCCSEEGRCSPRGVCSSTAWSDVLANFDLRYHFRTMEWVPSLTTCTCHACNYGEGAP